jgi:hypothetical protein
MRHPRALAFAAMLSLALAPVRAFAAEPPVTAPAVRLATAGSRVPAGAARLGPLPSDRQLTMSVILRPSHTTELAALLHDLYDPSSPRYGQWLATGEFDREFGPSPAEVAGVTSWLRGKGLLDTTVQGMTVRTTGSARDFARAFGVSFAGYRLRQGAAGYAASAPPLVPSAVAGGIATIVGLSDTVRFDSALDRQPRGIPPHASPRATTPTGLSDAHASTCARAINFAGLTYWTPRQVGSLYRMNDLFGAGLNGKGKTIALLELGQSRPADTSAYLSCFGLHNDVKIVHIDGGALPDTTGTLEAEIDTQEVATQAPGAAIVSYEAPNNASGEYDAYSRIVSENRAQVISTSWGKCEAALEAEPDFRGQPVMDALHTVFQQAAAQGQSVFAATGDTGSEDCYDGTSTPPSETLQVDHPADDPFVTGVGGTALLQPGLEPVWNECEGSVGDSCAAGGDHAGGGGLSNHYKRPSWQPLASNATCTTCREVPDISANAGVGETFFDSDSSSGPNPLLDHWTAVGGTSIAAPLLAGMAADITQTCKGGRLGNFAPKLNALAATHVYGSALVDVTQGFNWSTFLPETPGSIDLTRNHAGAYKTSTGFDLASGLGVPIASGLTCPHITSLSPNHGPPGIHVTVHGLGLEQATIKFGSKTATVLSRGPKTAVVVVPKGSGTLSVNAKGPIGSGSRTPSFSYPGSDTGAYRTAAANGAVFNFGGAHAYGAPKPASLRAPIVGMAVDRATGGYWLAAADGNVYNFNAPAYGGAGDRVLNQPIVGIAATKSGNGYWLVARDGGIFAFGGARFRGSTGGTHLNQPIVGIAADAAGAGYWLVASDGGIFAFDAPFHGSTGSLHLNKPIVGIAADAASGGYWLVASDGGIFAFDAPFYGSAGSLHLNKPIVGMAATDDARGYRFVASDGGVFNFGDARYSGSTGGSGLISPVVAVANAH